MYSNRALLLLTAMCLFIVPVLGQTQITIQNPSFETYNTLDHPDPTNGNYNLGPVPSWSGSGGLGFGSWQPTSTVYSALPNGPTVVFVGGGTILTQDLGVTFQANTTYVFTVYVGHRTAGFDNGNTISIIALYAGSTQLAVNNVAVSSIPGGTFAAETVSYTTGASPPSGDVIVSLGSSGTGTVQSDYDDVSLTHQSSISPLVITSPSTLPQAVAGVAYSFQETATGGITPYTWSITAGSLPAGLTMGASGLISGTPATGGPVTFTVSVTDSE